MSAANIYEIINVMDNRGFIWIANLVAYLTITSLTSTEGSPCQGSINSGRDGLFELSVIHLNDFHARFPQTGPNSGACVKGSENECVGGIARVYTASHQLVKERPNAIFLNAGDNFQGTLWYTIYRWNITATFLNMLPQDVMTLGNHDFDDRIAGLVPFIRMSNAPVVVTNIDDSEEPDIQGLYTNSTIIERNGTKIGVIGVILSTTDIIAYTEKLRFFDEVETINAEAKKLRENGINIIIVLSHCGLEVDKVIAASCPNVDLIVGGHSHTFLYTGTPPDTDVPQDKYPVVVKQEQTNRTVLIVQAAAFTKYLGNLSVWFDTFGEVVDWEGNPILLDSSVEENPDVLAALVPWKEAVDALENKVIGYSVVRFGFDCRTAECNVGNLITDAMVDAHIAMAENETHWTYAAVACTNAGGISSSLTHSKGVITYGDALRQQPYENTWDVLELLGSDLMQVLEYSVINSWSTTEFIGKNFLQWSGIRVVFNLENEPYSRVVSLRIRCRACEIPTYEEVVLDEWYRIVVPWFVANGGDGYSVIRNKHRNYERGQRDIDLYVKYIERISPITLGIEDRMILNGTWQG